MPILKSEPDLYPPELFGDAEESRRDENPPGSWWLVYTRSRREKELMRRLFAEKITYYAPTIPRRQRSPSGRIRESFIPLFTSYVFIHGTEEDRRSALVTNCVSTISPVDDGDTLFQELSQLASLLASNVPVTPEQKIAAGQTVEVKSGPLKGQKGVVIERLGRRRLLVSINLLQQGASADIDECDVEPI